ncbi:MAG TPA: hypothetical protein VGM88_19015 [Kofleriaceae bacterium]|jgi:hypothetical protein
MTEPSCNGLGCRVVNCTSMGQAANTSISGTVYAPNGTLPLFGFDVYIPQTDLTPFPDGVQCGRCQASLDGDPLIAVKTDENGNFKIDNAPSGPNIPLVISSGKWRRQIMLSDVIPCQDNPLDSDTTRLPRNKSEGDMPKIAVATGGADTMECLIHRLGIDDAEITTDSGDGKVNFFVGDGGGVSSFETGWPGGDGSFANATTLWNSLDKLSQYDIVMLSCEGEPTTDNKTQAAMDNMKMYADIGGRVFTTHYHGIWIAGGSMAGSPGIGEPEWEPIMNWDEVGNEPVTDLVDTVDNTEGPTFATWINNVGPTSGGTIQLINGSGRQTVQALDMTRAVQWVTDPGSTHAQIFQFTTPQEEPMEANRCGKVIFSDMHVAADEGFGEPFPDNCTATDLSVQEKALAFMFFEVASCIQVVAHDGPAGSTGHAAGHAAAAMAPASH